MPLLEYLYGQIRSTFEKFPHRFFTEHDIHSELTMIATDLLRKDGTLTEKTKDGYMTSRIHHEYPTPFRCRMGGDKFEVITEEDFVREKAKNPEFRARRGWVDFVILNPYFISSNKLGIVSAKRYKNFLDSIDGQKYPSLDLALEVVYYPTFDERQHVGIMKRKVLSAKQDYDKLVALMKFSYAGKIPFCREAAMLLFSNTKYRGELVDKLKLISVDESVSFHSILYR
jgi:hypothetical protein